MGTPEAFVRSRASHWASLSLTSIWESWWRRQRNRVISITYPKWQGADSSHGHINRQAASLECTWPLGLWHQRHLPDTLRLRKAVMDDLRLTEWKTLEQTQTTCLFCRTSQWLAVYCRILGVQPSTLAPSSSIASCYSASLETQVVSGLPLRFESPELSPWPYSAEHMARSLKEHRLLTTRISVSPRGSSWWLGKRLLLCLPLCSEFPHSQLLRRAVLRRILSLTFSHLLLQRSLWITSMILKCP